jgi:putative tricarboxylic transport membrane protein
MIGRVLALAVLAASGVYLANAWLLPSGTAARPGSGFYPLAVGVFGAAVALVWVVSAFRHGPVTVDGAALDKQGWTRVSVTAGLLIAFCLLLPWIGYSLAALLFTGLLLRGLGARWSAAAAIAAASALGSYYVFGVLLGVPLPRGSLFD